MLSTQNFKTRSIIPKPFSKRQGFTYVEVMIATAILSILAIPMSSSFYQAVQNQRFALDYYIGYLHSQNIADDLSYMLSDGFDAETLDQYFESDIQQYDLEQYSYHIYVLALHDEVPLYFQAGQSADPIPFTGVSYEGFPAGQLPTKPTFVIDGSNATGDSAPFIFYQDESLHISESLHAAYDLDLEIINTDKTIPIYNHSSHPIFIRLFSGSVEPQTTHIFVQQSETPKQGYVVTVDAYSGDRFIKRFLRFV